MPRILPQYRRKTISALLMPWDDDWDIDDEFYLLIYISWRTDEIEVTGRWRFRHTLTMHHWCLRRFVRYRTILFIARSSPLTSAVKRLLPGLTCYRITRYTDGHFVLVLIAECHDWLSIISFLTHSGQSPHFVPALQYRLAKVTITMVDTSAFKFRRNRVITVISIPFLDQCYHFLSQAYYTC
jgi:hypothetical protein